MTGQQALLLTGARTTESPETVDVLVSGETIVAVGADAAGREPAAERIDLADHLLLPAAVEPHAHLDKAMLVDRAANPTGDLASAIEANRAIYDSLTADDIRERALLALDIAVRNGYGSVRTHANLEPGIGLTAVTTLLEVAREVADEVELTIVALPGGDMTGAENQPVRALMVAAVEAGVDVVGGAPWFGEDPVGSVRWLVDCAADAGLPVDLHLDETLDAGSRSLEAFIEAVDRRGLGGRAVASHCVSLSQQDPEQVERTAKALAGAGIAVVALPQTNLGLQARDEATRIPRGVAPVRTLRRAGVRVAGGGDNWRDMFNPLGRIDPFETAALLVAAAHLSPAEAWRCVSSEACSALGQPELALTPGAPADLLAVRADSLAEAVAAAPAERAVLHRGRLVARTRLEISRRFSWNRS